MGAGEEREGRVDTGIAGAAAEQGTVGTEDNTAKEGGLGWYREPVTGNTEKEVGGVIMWGRIILRRQWWWEIMWSLWWEDCGG